jgi:hypothetical protein
VALAAAGTHLKWRNLAASEKGRYSYADFLAEFGGSGRPESRSTFALNLAKIHAHNAKGLSWTEGVNKFTDLSAFDFQRFKGKVFSGRDVAMAGLKTKFDAGIATEDLPASIDWREKVPPPNPPPNPMI